MNERYALLISALLLALATPSCQGPGDRKPAVSGWEPVAPGRFTWVRPSRLAEVAARLERDVPEWPVVAPRDPRPTDVASEN